MQQAFGLVSKSPPEELVALCASLLASVEAAQGPWIVLAPHPADEVAGATWLLTRAPELWVVHLTELPSADERLWPERAARDPAVRSALRQAEACAALGLAGVARERRIGLGYRDQELCGHLVELARSLHNLLVCLRPRVVVSPAYAGVHLDHDATAFAVRAACALLGREVAAPHLIEMRSAERGASGLRHAGFGTPSAAEVRCVLSNDERALKRRMLACHTARGFAGLSVDDERFRRAPACDFSRAPEPFAGAGQRLGAPQQAAHFCALAGRALERLGLLPCTPR